MSETLVDGTVVENRGALFEVQVQGRVVRCVLRGRLKHVKKGERRAAATPVAAGDRVRIALLEPGRGVIEEVLPRKTGLSRTAAGSVPLRQTLVANVDQAVIVFAAAEPRPDLFMLDRLIVAAVASALEPLIVVNKVDLSLARGEWPSAGWRTGDAAMRSANRLLVDGELLRAQFAVYRQWFRVLFTSAARGEGVAELREALRGRRSVVCGPSGVGKSSLLNAIAPGLNLRVGEVGDVTHKGRHTTSGVALLELPFGGWVADTAGLRQFGFWEVPPEQVGLGFPELAPYLGRCQYSNCSHRHEQGCAIREAVRSGKADARRVRSYLQLAGGST
jgi:ribosome biogenesis GTPase